MLQLLKVSMKVSSFVVAMGILRHYSSTTHSHSLQPALRLFLPVTSPLTDERDNVKGLPGCCDSIDVILWQNKDGR